MQGLKLALQLHLKGAWEYRVQKMHTIHSKETHRPTSSQPFLVGKVYIKWVLVQNAGAGVAPLYKRTLTPMTSQIKETKHKAGHIKYASYGTLLVQNSAIICSFILHSFLFLASMNPSKSPASAVSPVSSQDLPSPQEKCRKIDVRFRPFLQKGCALLCSVLSLQRHIQPRALHLDAPLEVLIIVGQRPPALWLQPQPQQVAPLGGVLVVDKGLQGGSQEKQCQPASISVAHVWCSAGICTVSDQKAASGRAAAARL